MSERLAVLARHLAAPGRGEQQQIAAAMPTSSSSLSPLSPSAQQQLSAFCPRELSRFMTHDNHELRGRIQDFLKDPLFAPNAVHGLSLSANRDLTLERLLRYVRRGQFFSVRDYGRDPRRFMAGLESLALVDYSLCIKAGVHFTLCGGTIVKLGTARHHDSLLDRMDSLELPGCFAMTELGHGSNVAGIETTAHYDERGGEFVLNTPGNDASKYWIGGAGQHGKLSAVFAQLSVGGVPRGVHVFAVRIRDDAGGAVRGVEILDHGSKAGLNGVDNGQIWFRNLRVPRESLLNALADVSPEGEYSSPIPSAAARFGATVGGLTTGRVLIASAAVEGVKLAAVIALRYSARRPQFGDAIILDYLTHANRLAPALAAGYAYHLALGRLKALSERANAKAKANGGLPPPSDAKAVHVLSSCLKAGATWTRVRCQQDARECCGGMGFLAANRIGVYKADQDVDVTFEGDNTVMMQQVAKVLLDSAVSEAKRNGGRVSPPPPPPSPSGDGDFSCPRFLLSLAQWREAALVSEIATDMLSAAAAAARGGSGNKTAIAEAMSRAYDARMDDAVEIGWARADAETLSALADAASGETAAAGDEINGVSPAAARPALRVLAVVHGASVAVRSAAFYLSRGALCPRGFSRLREARTSACAVLCSGGEEAPALRLADGFGIPEHLIAAPIATGDWKKIGEGLGK